MADLNIMPKYKRTLMLAFGSLVFVAIGVLLFTLSGEGFSGETLWLKFVGILAVVVFGFCVIYYVIVFIKREPALVITDAGIIDQSSFIGAGLVKWKEIEEIGFVQFGGQVFLGIMTFDRELIINRSSGLKKVLNQLNKGLLETQVNIPVKNLAFSEEQLIESLMERWEQAVEKENIDNS